MKIPIVFFNFGNHNFLDIALKQAKHHNPESDIYLIGDDTNYKDYVKFIHYNELLSTDIPEFDKNFVNLSTNNKKYEFICFLRWYLIRNLIKRDNITRLFVTDSDVMYYCDITKEANNFNNYRYTLTHNVSAGIGFINDISCITAFCNLSTAMYTNNTTTTLHIDGGKYSNLKYYYDKHSNIYETRKLNNLAGGVCDMSLWGELRNMGNPGLVGETSAIINDSTFDHNINAVDAYKHENGIKKFTWKDKIPYCYNTWLERDIKFNCIHFQGGHRKELMKEFATY